MDPATFILVGAPKCGTTSLFHYLSEHPRLHVATPKEPLYWCDDFEPYRIVKTRSEYDQVMSPPPSALAKGEGSTMYLLSQRALPAIREYRPDAKILLAIRNPVELFLSWHGWMLQALEEDQADPETAWRLQEERSQGRSLPATSQVPFFIQYREVCSLGQHVRRLLEVFPREQIHVVVFEEFIRSPREVYEGVLAFLGVPSDGRVEFPKMNERRAWRNAWAAKLYRRPPAPIRPIIELVRRTWLSLPAGVQQPFRSMFFSHKVDKPAISPQFREILVQEFAEDTKRLEELLNINLGSWGYGVRDNLARDRAQEPSTV